MALLDVNAMVALAWDSHVHHHSIQEWFLENAEIGWQTTPITESGFVRVSSNPRVLPVAIDIASAKQALVELRKIGRHRFLTDGVSITDPDFPAVHGYRQITDAHLLTVARRNSLPLLTFDSGIASLAKSDEVILLRA